MKETINPTERAAMDAVREKTRPELSKRAPRIDHIDHRRLGLNFPTFVYHYSRYCQ